MKIEQVGAITSSIRKFCDDVPAFEESMKKVKEIGYQAVQISAIAHIPEEDVIRVCGDLGLTICATHERGQTIVEEPEKVIEKLGKFNCKLTAVPFPHLGVVKTEEEFHQMAKELDKAGAALIKSGITLMYHNHDIEFQRFNNKTGLEIIYDETNPENLQGEPDTHWIQAGGGCPVLWCEKLKGRLPVLHMKDYAMEVTDEGRGCKKEAIGSGNLDWQKIVKAAEESGCQWYVVEHDGGTFESLESSFNFIKNELCS